MKNKQNKYEGYPIQYTKEFKLYVEQNTYDDITRFKKLLEGYRTPFQITVDVDLTHNFIFRVRHFDAYSSATMTNFEIGAITELDEYLYRLIESLLIDMVVFLFKGKSEVKIE